MPLYTKEPQPNFPAESNGTKKIRYPENVVPQSAPASTNLVAGSASIVPFYLNQGVSGFSAVSNAIGSGIGGGPWGLKVAVYSANSGLYTASLIESVDISINSVPTPRTATFVSAGANLGEGWYILSAFWDGTGTNIQNSGNYIPLNAGIIGTSGVVGSYLPSQFRLTGLSSMPATLALATLSATAADYPCFFPYY